MNDDPLALRRSFKRLSEFIEVQAECYFKSWHQLRDVLPAPEGCPLGFQEWNWTNVDELVVNLQRVGAELRRAGLADFPQEKLAESSRELSPNQKAARGIVLKCLVAAIQGDEDKLRALVRNLVTEESDLCGDVSEQFTYVIGNAIGSAWKERHSDIPRHAVRAKMQELGITDEQVLRHREDLNLSQRGRGFLRSLIDKQFWDRDSRHNDKGEPKDESQPTPPTQGNGATTAATESTDKPIKLLLNWRDILDKLGLKKEDRRRVGALNKRFGGPIKSGGRGSQPTVGEAELIEWWNGLSSRYEHSQERQESQRESTKAEYLHGRDAIVKPDIGGSVKRRRKSGGQT